MKLNAKGHEISVIAYEDQQEYISLTDIAKQKNPDAPADIIKNWLRSRSTIEYLGLWESLNNFDLNWSNSTSLKMSLVVILLY